MLNMIIVEKDLHKKKIDRNLGSRGWRNVEIAPTLTIFFSALGRTPPPPPTP